MEKRKPDLILVRGLPGSGKSTLSKKFSNYHHVEADMYWGLNYDFDIKKIGDAHSWCLKTTKNILSAGYNVVVSNTFLTLDELEPYFKMAKELDITLSVLLCQGNFKSIHNVPDDVLDEMKGRFQLDLTKLFDKVFGVSS